jgi:hypothetical protein
MHIHKIRNLDIVRRLDDPIRGGQILVARVWIRVPDAPHARAFRRKHAIPGVLEHHAMLRRYGMPCSSRMIRHVSGFVIPTNRSVRPPCYDFAQIDFE